VSNLSRPWTARSTNRSGHRIGACFGKAALKTHALQALRDRRASPNRAKRLECVRFIRFIGAFRPERDGPRFMVPMHAKNDRRLSMNLPKPRQVLECFPDQTGLKLPFCLPQKGVASECGLCANHSSAR
jgi:hypothetical protein